MIPKTAVPALAVLALLLVPGLGAAQGVRSVRLAWDNDILALRGDVVAPDHDYTHGLRLSVRTNAAPLWGRVLDRIAPCSATPPAARPCLATDFELGQEIYTPRTNAPEPVAGERPYAGWLYAAATARVTGAARERSLRIEIGVTGPPAGGKAVQNGIHELFGFRLFQGWDHQLAFEPAFLIRYRDVRLLHGRLPVIGGVRVAPYWGAALGTVRTGAHAGVELWLGPGGRGRSGGPLRAAPGAAAAGWYAVIGVRQNLVLHNLFLDGNTFRESVSAETLPLPTRGRVGVGYRFPGWSMEYRFVVRGRRYRAQPDSHRYGSVVVTVYPGE